MQRRNVYPERKRDAQHPFIADHPDLDCESPNSARGALLTTLLQRSAFESPDQRARLTGAYDPSARLIGEQPLQQSEKHLAQRTLRFARCCKRRSRRWSAHVVFN